MATQDLQILHAIPGRIRVKIPRLKDNQPLAEVIHQKLGRIRVVDDAVVNPVTGSVLVTYDPGLLESLHSPEMLDTRLLEAMHELIELGETLGIRPTDIDTRALEDWFRTRTNGIIAPASSAVAGAVATLFGTLDTKVAQASNGWSDLRALIPLLLFGLGVRSLLVTERLPFPAWYDYFWFAFSTFVALHPSQSAQT